MGDMMSSQWLHIDTRADKATCNRGTAQPPPLMVCYCDVFNTKVKDLFYFTLCRFSGIV